MNSSPRGRFAKDRIPVVVRFALAGGVAAAVNFGARIALSIVMSFGAAIVCAYVAGMATAFVLNRRYVFVADGRLSRQIGWFIAVNVLALAQTFAISLLLARIVFPALHFGWHVEEAAHAIGIVVPIVTSYFGHKYVTFRCAR